MATAPRTIRRFLMDQSVLSTENHPGGTADPGRLNVARELRATTAVTGYKLVWSDARKPGRPVKSGVTKNSGNG